MAVGILAIGMLFIAGVFPVSIHFTTVSSERTIAATVADEAFAKIKLYGVAPLSLSDANQTPFAPVFVPSDEYSYPSTPTIDPNSKKFWWSALCKRVPGSLQDVQVTVFVSRKAGVSTLFRTPLGATNSDRPLAVPVEVRGTTGGYELTITGNKTLINDGYNIVDGAAGQIYRVMERYVDDTTTPLIDESQIIRLEKPWRPEIPPQSITDFVWVTPPPPPPVGGRYPCIAVYQKVMRF